MLDSDKSCSTNVMYYSTIDKLVLSNHLYQMHSLLAEFLQTLRNINNLREEKNVTFQDLVQAQTLYKQTEFHSFMRLQPTVSKMNLNADEPGRQPNHMHLQYKTNSCVHEPDSMIEVTQDTWLHAKSLHSFTISAGHHFNADVCSASPPPTHTPTHPTMFCSPLVYQGSWSQCLSHAPMCVSVCACAQIYSYSCLASFPGPKRRNKANSCLAYLSTVHLGHELVHQQYHP